MELRNALSATFSLSLPATVTFDHPTPMHLARHIAGLLPMANKQAGADDSSASEEEVLRPLYKLRGHQGRRRRRNSRHTTQQHRRKAAASSADLQASVVAVVSEVLGVTAVEPQALLMEAGLDSMGAVELRNALSGG